MKCVILCGGLGTRFSEETDVKPKPMIEIKGKPILQHLMECYARFGFCEFILCGGYKINVIKDYFLKLKYYTSDLKVNFNEDNVEILSKKNLLNWKIWIIDTGQKSQTASRIFKIKKLLKNEDNFFMTYGDGLSNVNISKLLKFHITNKKIGTMTIVRPIARFGHIKLKDNLITEFKEKDQISEGWINGGFFVLNTKIFKYISPKEDLIFEKKPLENLSKDNQLVAYKHHSFWHPMDTLRDKRYLEKISNRKLLMKIF